MLSSPNWGDVPYLGLKFVVSKPVTITLGQFSTVYIHMMDVKELLHVNKYFIMKTKIQLRREVTFKHNNCCRFLSRESKYPLSEILRFKGPRFFNHIALNIACIGTTLTLLFRRDMLSQYIQKWQVFIKGKSSISTFQNGTNKIWDPHFDFKLKKWLVNPSNHD